MTTFDQRKDAFENLFAHDEALKFRAMARRNKQLGLWVAGKLGKSGVDADTYATETVISDFEEAGDQDVFRKIRGDFDAAGIAETDQAIRQKMDEFLAKAVTDLKTES